MSGPAALEGLRRGAPAETETRIPEPPSRRGSRVVLPAVIVVVFLGIVAFAARDALRTRRDVRIVPVVVRAGGGTGGGTVVATAAGWIEPDPYPVHVSALTDGVVQEVLVLEGGSVAAGQVVARLVPDDAQLDVDGARARVAIAEATLRTAAAQLTAAETDSANPVALERALAVAVARAEEATAERVRLDRDVAVVTARIAELEDAFARSERAVKSGAVSANETTQLRLQIVTQRAAQEALVARRPVLDARVKEAAAEHTAAERDLDLRVELIRALETARAGHAHAQADLADARVELGEAELRLARTDVRAPVAGVVMRRLVDPGGRLMLQMDMKESSWAVDLYDPEKLQVRVDVPLADAGQVGVGQSARVHVETLPDRTFPAEVTRLVHFADIQKNTVEVKVRLLETAPELKPEMLARVEILGAERADAADVARKGVVFAPERLVSGGAAWVVGSGGDTAERRTVSVGRGRSDEWIEIASGLQPGDRLIDAPADGLESGEAIRIVGEVAR